MIKSEWLKNFRLSSRNRRLASRNSARPAAIERLEDRALLAAQVVTGSPLNQDIRPGSAVAVDVTYTTLDDTGDPADLGSTGLGVGLFFDSSQMTSDNLSDVYTPDFLQQDLQPDTANADNDVNTDFFINVAWARIGGGATWGQGVQPLRLYSANFTMVAGFTGSTTLNFARTSQPVGFPDFESNNPVINEFITPDVSISDAADVTEGGNSVFDVVLSTNPSGVVTVTYDTVDGTATVADSDFAQASSATLTFTPGGSLTQQISIPTTADGNVEPDEGFQVTLTGADNGNVVTATGSAVILNDDVPTVSVSDAGDVSEGDTANFVVSLDQAPLAAVTVDVGTVGGTAASGGDFAAVNRTLTFLPGGLLAQTVAVNVANDMIAELDEGFQLALFNSSGATIDVAGSAGAANILANDEPSVSVLSLGDANEGQPAVFIVRLSNAPAADVTVDYNTVDGAALGGVDFTAASGTLTFEPGGSLTQQVNIATTNDTLVEADENFSLAISNVNGGSLGTDQAPTVIRSEDLPAITVAGGGLIAEGQDAVFTVSLDQAPISQVSLVISTVDGTAMAGLDFAGVTGQTLTFDPGAGLTQTITVSTNNDTLSEVDESFALSIDSFDGATTAVSSATATITVNDDPVISIADNSVNEGVGSGGIQVTLDQTPSRTLTVEFSTRDGSAVAGTDYTTTTGTLTFTPGSALTQTIVFPVLEDTLVEGNENLFVDLLNPVNGTISDAEGEVIIVSDDVPTVTVTAPATVAEGQDVVLVFTIDQAPVSDGFITISTADGSAIAGSDYTGIANPLQVPFTVGGPLTQQVTIPTANDAVLENDEAFTIDLAAGQLINVGTPASVTATITSDDVPAVSVSDVSASEDGNIVFVVSVSESPLAGQDVTVELSTTDGTALAGIDYTAVAGQLLTFTSGGALTQDVVVTVTDDSDVEIDETLTATLSNVGNGTIATTSATGTIINNDLAAVSIGDVNIVNEGDDIVFTVSLDQAPAADVVVTLSTADGTALADSDYTAITDRILTFTADGELTQAVTVSTVDDTLSELDESFSLTITNADGGAVADGESVATISGSDLPRISISDVVDVNEGGQAVFVVSLDQSPAQTLTIDYSTADGTAIAGGDYTAVSGTLTFDPGAPLTQEITVALGDDDLVEATEDFTVELSNPTNVVIADAEATGSIVSADVPTVSLSSNVSTVAEGNNAVFTLTLDQATLADLTVDIATTDDTAIAGTDYTAVSRTVTFIAGGSLTQQVTVETTNDGTVELSKSFGIGITNPSGVMIGADTATGTITSDDVPTISAVGTSAAEGDAVTFTITIDQLPLAGSDVSVDVATSDDVAIAGTDYTALASQTLTFTSADTVLSQTLSVSTTEDRNVEADETFFLDLSNADGGTVHNAQATGTITNDDIAIPVTISVDATEGSESEGSVITITATSAGSVLTDEMVDVTITGTNVTAADATLSSTMVTIPAGQTTGSVTLTIENDAEFEGDETATVTFVNPTGNLQLSDATANIVIRDSEAPQLDATPRFSNSLRPVLTWQEAPAAASYEVYFARLVPGEARLFASQSIVTTGSFQSPANLTAAVYRYWVRTIDADGVGGTWSTSNTFEIQPLLVNPLTPTFTARPVFEWFPIPHADSYQIFVRTSTGDIVVDNITDTQWTPTSDLPAGPVFWWIRASDRQGNRGWSARGRTGIQTTVTAPVGDAIGSSPTIQWLETQGASRYILHVELVSTREVVIRENNLTTTSFTASGLASGEYRVWVKAIDASGAFSSGQWSRAFDFAVADAETNGANGDVFLTQLTVMPTELLNSNAEEIDSTVQEITVVSSTSEAADSKTKQKPTVKQSDAGVMASESMESLDDLMSNPASLARVFDHAMFAIASDEN